MRQGRGCRGGPGAQRPGAVGPQLSAPPREDAGSLAAVPGMLSVGTNMVAALRAAGALLRGESKWGAVAAAAGTRGQRSAPPDPSWGFQERRRLRRKLRGVERGAEKGPEKDPVLGGSRTGLESLEGPGRPQGRGLEFHRSTGYLSAMADFLRALVFICKIGIMIVTGLLWGGTCVKGL